MKKLLFSGLMTLVSQVSSGQLVPKDASNAFLVFQRGDGIDTYYKINSVRVFIDDATIGRSIEANSGIELVGFARTQKISTNIFEFVSAPSDGTKVVKTWPDIQISGLVRLDIPGYSAVSDIYLAEEGMKLKNPARLNIQLATHSISLGENIGQKRSLVNYKITDQNGKVWVEVIQKQTSTEGRLGGLFGNNHPDKQYLDLVEDCNVNLPLPGKYTIEVENRGELTVDFWVTYPWSADAVERRLHREDIPPSRVSYYTIDTELLGLSGMKDYERTIKINCNGKL